ncbi:alpha/beta fold hydrolase [Owenweeksia hongkongensis]|uniref:alpha/beta fold hydrolase n=1 Tax=Owenweeksia hongkongensis TaxID=253245 RepID=UPI003A8E6C23
MSTRTFTFKQVTFHFTSKGSGPTILFLHGFLENKEMWNGIINSLPTALRKITVDLPGHGKSGNIGYIHTMEEMAEMVKALVDKLKLKKVFLAGHSMGGYVALAFAEKHPEMVKGIILMNSTTRADSDQKKKDRDRAIKLVKETHKSFIRNAIPHLFRPKNRRNMMEHVNHVKAEALKTSKQGIIAALEGMKIRDDREVLLHFAPYPFLFIAAKNDPVFPFEVLEDQLQANRVTPCITENGHMAHLEDFDTVLPAIKKFIREN